MQALKGKHIYLRALEPEDIQFLFTTENDTSFWEISSTQTPFSKFILEQYIANSHQDIYTAKQLRLIIAKNTSDQAIGMIAFKFFHCTCGRAKPIALFIRN